MIDILFEVNLRDFYKSLYILRRRTEKMKIININYE